MNIYTGSKQAKQLKNSFSNNLAFNKTSFRVCKSIKIGYICIVLISALLIIN